MEFLGIGYQEVLLVLVLMLIVVGPARMPTVAYQIGKAVREMQKYARAVRDEFSDEWEYLDTQAKEIRGEVDSASKDMRELQRSFREETKALDTELKSATAEVQKALPAATPSSNGNGGATGVSATGARPTLSSANVSIAGRKPAVFPTQPATKPASPTSESTGSPAGKSLPSPGTKPAAVAKTQEPEAGEGSTGDPAAAKKSTKPPLVF
ncbi:MAG: twin-arginine translocase TatA/TatE family subunit [Dehalococcoidia bacterium]|nr:twin-arginine translocase TatA/TatE family subunit [Dehalococcoidia bacterium]